MNGDMRCRIGKWGMALYATAALSIPALTQAQNMMNTRTEKAQMLVQTLSEEKTEINTLAAQQARFRAMGDRESLRIQRLWGLMIRDHKAGGPTFMRLIRANGGDPDSAKILKPPVLGDKAAMLHATHMDHVNAVRTSQMRYGMTNDRAIKNAMKKRANTARKHIRWMMPLMRGMDMDHANMSSAGNSGAKMAMMCPHCDVAMKNGKCPMCGMTAAQMKKM